MTWSFTFSSVSIVTRLEAERTVIDFRQVYGRILPLRQCPDRLWGLSSLKSNGYWQSFTGGKTAGV